MTIENDVATSDATPSSSSSATEEPPPPRPPPPPPPPPQQQGGPPPGYDHQARYQALKDKPIAVESVEIQGIERTRRGILEAALEPLYRASSLDDLRDKCVDANGALNAYDVFESIDIVCDAGASSRPDTASVIVRVEEKKRLNLKGGAFVSQARSMHWSPYDGVRVVNAGP